ncbi:MAG: chromosomal replication initiator protein DnaA [Alphaproteobacteria bacterium]|nr:chromosomal replication initiator protein DnaA [Alphaproteobacteria bacterium]
MVSSSHAAASDPESEAHTLTAIAQNAWDQVYAILEDTFGAITFQSWLQPLFFKEFFSGRLVLAAPSRFMRDWVEDQCAAKILTLLQAHDSRILALDFVVDNAPRPTTPSKPQPVASIPQDTSPSFELDEDLQEVVGSRLDPRYTFDNFVVGRSNELAYAAARRVAEAESVTFNPLFLYGGVGLGKTHLMHAIAWHIQSRHSKRKVVYLSAEKFMYQFIKALRFRDTVAFKEKFRSVDVLMIDDFQFIGGKDSTQEEFFHTFNALVDQNHQVIISADKSPSDLEGLEERMRSRLGWGLVADIHPTTYELRLGILQSKSSSLDVHIPEKVLEFLAHKITSNVRELEGALNRIVAHTMLVGREITIDSVQEVLRDLLRASDRRISIEEIQKKVAEHYNIRLSDMHSAKRLRSLARPRQIAMYLAKTLTPLSLPEIGRKFGGRDHTTVMHAIKKVESLKGADRSLAEDLDLLQRMLQTC